METRILDAQVSFLHQAFSTPLRLSSGVITEITEARAEVTVEVAGQRATGRGSIYLSDLWAWPDPSLSHEQRDGVLRARCVEIAARLPELCGAPAHPLELGLRLHHSVTGAEAAGGPPVLARALCASPFDAALHDAAGIALGRSAFHLYWEAVPIPAADGLFAGGSACAAVERVLRPKPAKKLDAWLVVAPGEALAREMEPWTWRGYRCFKLKLLGKSAAEDAAFTAEVFRTARELRVTQPRLSGDPNGGYPGPAETLEYLERLRELDAEAFAALEHVEQPTGRDIMADPHDWRAPSRLKPIILDEGLSGPEVMEEAVAQGWSGFALKTCKGHSFNLVAAAWAAERGLPLAVQDLTNPGFAFIHSALLAACIPSINGAELNSPQFTPSANAEWLPRLSALFEPRDGRHQLPTPLPPGLGSML